MASDTLPPRKFAGFATLKRYNEIVRDHASAVDRKEPEHNRVGQEAQASTRGQHIFSIALGLAASLTSAAIFLASLLEQLAPVEIAASLCTAVQVFFFSSAIADLIGRGKTSRSRNFWVVLFAVLLIAFYGFTRYVPLGRSILAPERPSSSAPTGAATSLTCAAWPNSRSNANFEAG